MDVTNLSTLSWQLCELPLAQIHLDTAFDRDDAVQAPIHLVDLCRYWQHCLGVIVAVHDVKASDASTGRYLVLAGQPLWRAAQQAGLTTIPAIVIGDEPLPLPIRAIIRGIRRDTMDAKLGAYLASDIQRHVASIGVDAGTPMGWTVAELTEARRNAERPQEERNTLGDRSRVIWRESRVSDPARRSALLNDPEALASRSKLRRAKESTSHLGNAADEVDVNRVNATLNEPESETLAPLASVPAQDDGVAGGIRQSVTVGDLVNMPGEAPRQIDDAYRENVAQSQHLDTVKEPSLAQRSHPILEAPDGTEQIDEKSPPLPPQALAALANDALGVSAPSSQLAELAHLAHSAQSSYLRHCATCSCATTSESACPGVQELKS